MKVDNLENKTAVLKVKVDHTRFQNVVDLRNSFQINLLINQYIIGQISKTKKNILKHLIIILHFFKKITLTDGKIN